MDFLRLLAAFPATRGFGEPQNVGHSVVPELRSFQATEILDSGVEVAGQGFHGHMERRTPSKSPGIDVDVTYDTEHLANGERPTVRSPVSGEVVFRGPGRDGTVRIRDRNGYEHTVLHNRLNFEGPIEGRMYPLGETVQKGDPIGVVGNQGTARDHVHYSIKHPAGYYVDPKNQNFDKDGTVLGPRDHDAEIWDRWTQERPAPEPQKFDRVGGPDPSNIA